MYACVPVRMRVKQACTYQCALDHVASQCLCDFRGHGLCICVTYMHVHHHISVHVCFPCIHVHPHIFLHMHYVFSHTCTLSCFLTYMYIIMSSYIHVYYHVFLHTCTLSFFHTYTSCFLIYMYIIVFSYDRLLTRACIVACNSMHTLPSLKQSTETHAHKHPASKSMHAYHNQSQHAPSFLSFYTPDN